MEYKEVLSNTKEYPLKKTTLLHEWGERREMVSPKRYLSVSQWYLSLKQ